MQADLVFLCGFPSSGTDLLKNVMNAHPDICIQGEFPFLPHLAREYGAAVPGWQAPDAVAALQRIDVYHNLCQPDLVVSPLQAEYELAGLYAAMLTDEPCKWTGNKTPQNTEQIEPLCRLFPKAKFVLIVRDIRDVALSWSKKWGKHKALCAHKWHVRMQRGDARLRDLDAGACLVIKYEELLADLEGVAVQLCDFLELEFHPGMLDYPTQVQQTVEGKLNYGKALIRDNSNKWRRELTSRQIRRIEEVAFPSLQLFGYPITQATGYRPLTRIEKCAGYLWDGIALLLVGNRAIEQNRLRHRCKTLLFEGRKLLSRLRTGVSHTVK
jgi:hypothetical protein